MTVQFSHLETSHTAQEVERHKASQTKVSCYRNFGKRALDVLLTLMAIPFALPLITVSAFLIMLDGHNPFYSQLRVGRNGKHFRMWKLRSMVHNADALLEEYLSNNPDARREWIAHQKLKHDPRITWFGAFLRKSSIDELPQLLNVLNGTMSLVGPRPMMVSQRQDYTGRAYFQLKPGVTGLWQVSDRNQCEFIQRVYFDELYEDILSIKTDLGVLLKTVVVVMRGTGC